MNKDQLNKELLVVEQEIGELASLLREKEMKRVAILQALFSNVSV